MAAADASAILDLSESEPGSSGLPMLIRSEGVGLKLQNRRERGKKRTKMHFVSECFVYNCMFGRGRAVNKFRD